jgi:hypothetical protein
MYNIYRVLAQSKKGDIVMDLLKKLFPLSFKLKDITALVIAIIIYVVADVVVGVIVGLLWWAPIVGLLISAIASLVGLYTLIGIVLAILEFCGVLKEA